MPTFELRGWYVSHDVKFADDITTSVELPARPTREQAEGILLPLAWAELERWCGGADDLQFTSVEVDGSPA
ncbi:hypothetical protein [Mycobacterium sp.]|uniref:hypothetical protein n=1 Tax=Mycobacterium sp. TaxID=1785 RepID=UPI003F97129B